MNFDVSQNIDIDTVIAEKFEYFRQAWRKQQHPGSMPRTFVMRPVHVAETDVLAREEAEKVMLSSRDVIRDGIEKTRIGFKGTEPTPTNLELNRVFQGMNTSFDFWLDNGLALVGSPETVLKQLKTQHELLGYDIFCANHRFGPMAAEMSNKSMKLFAQEVMPAITQ